MSSAYWSRTIQLLQPTGGASQLVSKPTLKPELLQSVPFKFLHDVIVAVRFIDCVKVLRKTHFCDGLYTVDELNRKWEGFDKERVVRFLNTAMETLTKSNKYCDNILAQLLDHAGSNSLPRGKAATENKRNFLGALQNVLEMTLNEPIACNVKEVLRGKDAEGANNLLQCLAKAADLLQLDGSDAMQRHHKGEVWRRKHTSLDANVSVGCASVDGQSHRQSLADQFPTDEDPICAPCFRGYGAGTMAQTETGPSGKGSSEAVQRVSSPSGPNSSGHATATAQLQVSKETALAPSSHNDAWHRTLQSEGSAASEHTDPALASGQAPSSHAPARPMTAKKAPPATKAFPSLNAQGLLASGLRPSSLAKAACAYEDLDDPQDEDIITIVQHNPKLAAVENSIQGALLNDMMQVKKEAEVATVYHENTGCVAPAQGITLGCLKSKRTKSGTSARVDVESIQGSLQYIVQQLVPLVRCMDYLQEDRESMQKELHAWRREALRWQEKLAAHQAADASAVQLKSECFVLQQEIEKKKLQLRLLHRQVLENDVSLDNFMKVVTDVS